MSARPIQDALEIYGLGSQDQRPSGPAWERDVPPPEMPEDLVDAGANGARSDAPAAADDAWPRAASILAAQCRPVDDLIDGHLPMDITVLSGLDGTYKTLVATAIATALAAGARPFDAWTATAPTRVLMVSEEDSLDVLQNRVAALVRGHEWDEAAVRTNLVGLALEGIALDTDNGARTILANVRELKPTLVIFDPLSNLMFGDENSNSDARRVISLWHQLVREGVAVLAVMHHGKPPAEGGPSRGPRGASAFRAASRAHYVVTRNDRGPTLTCDKLSRRPKTDPVELVVTVTADPGNASMWTTATLTAPGQGDSWVLSHRRDLRPSELKALSTLDAHPNELLTFSTWQKNSGIGHSALSEAQKRLVDLRYVDRLPTGKQFMGKPGFGYSITDEGKAALLRYSAPTPPATPGSSA